MTYKLTHVLILPAFILIHACATNTPLTPSQTAQQFWTAVLEHDLQVAQRYSTQDSKPELSEIELDLSDAAVEFENVKLMDSNAQVSTTITFPQMKNKQKIAFQTFIDKEGKEWKVDLIETRKSIQDATSKRPLGQIFDNIRKYSDDFSGSLDELVKKWSDATPEIRKDLETLGEATREEVEDAIKHLAPEIKDGIRDFRNSIAEALKQLEPEDKEPEQQKPPSKPKMI